MSSPFDVNYTKCLESDAPLVVGGSNYSKGIIIKSDKFITAINDILSIDINHMNVLYKYINKKF